jgi:hypothetical protein
MNLLPSGGNDMTFENKELREQIKLKTFNDDIVAPPPVSINNLMTATTDSTNLEVSDQATIPATQESTDPISTLSSSLTTALPAAASSVTQPLSTTLDVYGFPLLYPSYETETLEDLYLSCEMVLTINNNKIGIDGVLLLTSLRLLFISYKRLLMSSPATDNSNGVDTTVGTGEAGGGGGGGGIGGGGIPGINHDIDLTTQIWLSSVHSVQQSSENDSFDQNVSYDAIKIKTADCRCFTFLFKDANTPTTNAFAGLAGSVLFLFLSLSFCAFLFLFLFFFIPSFLLLA